MPGRNNRILLNNVSKKFNIGFQSKQSTLQKLLSSVSGKERQEPIRVLDKITLEVNAGETFGIIGPNGSGKSTLLRVIAGIYLPDEGLIKVGGNIVSLINLYVGLKERITMKDNIFLVGSLFGTSRKDIEMNFDRIVDFSGLGDFIDTKIYQFSLGMMQRLVFSIAVHSNPDVLLLDEVFEFGDGNFHQKSMNKIKAITDGGASVVLVTHDMDMLKKYCNRAVLLNSGRIVCVGDPVHIARGYADIMPKL